MAPIPIHSQHHRPLLYASTAASNFKKSVDESKYSSSPMIKNAARYAIVLISLGSMVACKQNSGTGGESAKLETEDQKTLYALGLLIGRNVKPFALKPEELSIVKAGLTDSVNGAKPQVEIDTYGPKVNELADRRSSAGLDETKKKGQEFADNVAKQKDASTTPSGIVIRSITAGSGPNPAPDDVVKVHYEGKLIDGTIFDSSIQRGEPAEFPLNEVVPCWREALQKLKKGGKAQVVCPSDAAYGDRGQPPAIPPGATLTFEVELLDFHKP
jgi:FKBP-type peptidyl-prolyl cis-trans isomerase FkpA